MISILPRLFGVKGANKNPKPSGPLTREGLLASDLWLDQPDAHAQIAQRLAAGTHTGEQAEKLRCFVDRGYLTLALDLADEVYADVWAAVERLWREKPWSVAFAYHSPLKVFALADEARDRRPSCRIADLHSESSGALALYLNRQIFDYVELIWGQPAVATQSLTFEYGSQQALHRDPVHVHTSPPSHLVAAWIALEDIGPRCGALTYIPGSHRLPYWRDAKGDYRLHQASHGEAEIRAALDFDLAQCARRGLAPELFTCRRGEVLIWHHSLLHGGSPPEDPALTRKSFVVHFSTQANYKRLRQTVLEPARDAAGNLVERSHTFGTDRLLERDGCRGFDNPLRNYRGPDQAPATKTAPSEPTS
jgi:ectoine hydroxylase-related dioxygenase (phytanoyl-CoA dioxygenase family)